MTQTLLVVVLFVAAMAALPWLVRRLQQRHAGGGQSGAGAASRVLSAVAVGPQQRVVTVEVGPDHARTLLVLGVTAQQISCLHVMPANDWDARTQPPAGVPSFSQEMVAASKAPAPSSNG